jgi:hypothetical protein
MLETQQSHPVSFFVPPHYHPARRPHSQLAAISTLNAALIAHELDALAAALASAQLTLSHSLEFADVNAAVRAQAVEVAAAASAALAQLCAVHDPALAALRDALSADSRRTVERIASALAAAEALPGGCGARGSHAMAYECERAHQAVRELSAQRDASDARLREAIARRHRYRCLHEG